MADVTWIKLSTDIFNDEKIKLIESMPESDTMIIIWFKLLTLAGKSNASGYLTLNNSISYTDEMLATIFNRPLNSVRMALQTFQQFGMIDIDNSIYHITNWDKHQNVGAMNVIREQTRLRVAKHREKQKLLQSNVTCNVTETQSNAIDIDIELDKEKEYISSNDDIVDCSTHETEICTSQTQITEPIKESKNEIPPYDAIKELFHVVCPTLPKIKEIKGSRQKTLLVIWRQYKSLEYFRELFELTARSDFLSGRDGKWHGCCFDWILAPKNRTKIFEGNYENRGSPGNSKVIQCGNFKQRDYAGDIDKYYANINYG
jgi:predicted phage replisome organizer